MLILALFKPIVASALISSVTVISDTCLLSHGSKLPVPRNPKYTRVKPISASQFNECINSGGVKSESSCRLDYPIQSEATKIDKLSEIVVDPEQEISDCIENGYCTLDYVPDKVYSIAHDHELDVSDPAVASELETMTDFLTEKCNVNLTAMDYNASNCIFDRVDHAMANADLKELVPTPKQRKVAKETFGVLLKSGIPFSSFVMVASAFAIIAGGNFAFDGNAVWRAIVEKVSAFHLVVTFTAVWTTSLYWGYAAVLNKVGSILGQHYPLSSFKIQPKKHVPFDQRIKCFKQVALNQLLINVPMAIAYYAIMPRMGWDINMPLPTVKEFFLQLAVFLGITETWYYWTHRIAHMPQFYKKVHAQHHEYKSPFAEAAIYAHPFEHFAINLLPLFLGPIFLKSHLTMLWAWMSCSTVASLHSHMGFVFPNWATGVEHDFHHTHYLVNYGQFGIWDRIMGTDKLYTDFMEKTRNETQS